MKRKRNLILDNRGGSLILVIVCISFVSILCSVLLSVAVNNIQMKSVDRLAKSNFYGAEIAIDEIKKGIEEVAAVEMEEAYNEAMGHFIDKTEDEKKQIFHSAFVLGLIEKLGDSMDSAKYNRSFIMNLIKQREAVFITMEGTNQLLINTLSDTSEIALKNISVKYVDENSYETSITTDIVIEVPSLSFNYSAASVRPTFSEYSLIADQKIVVDTAPHVSVKGNAYAGLGGILINNGSSLNISNASYIITRGNIQVQERSSLSILDNPKIWVKNIETNAITSSNSPTSIQMYGRCYVADDLMLNAENSSVTISGEYYGYSYDSYKKSATDTGEKASNSSAIILNGYKSSLDLSATNKLVIAGRAFLDPLSKGNDYKEEQGSVQTGESLAIKGNQLIYLVPSEYIWCGQNPVSVSMLDEGLDGVKEVDFDKIVSDSKINLKEYVDPENGYTKIVYQLGDKQNFVYYYLKFASKQKANQYMQKYYEVYNKGASVGIIDNNVKRFATSIKINPLNTRMSLGNVFTFDSETGKSVLRSNTINPDAVDNVNLQAFVQMASNLSDKYDALKENLTEISIGEPYNKDSLFHTLIHYENIKNDDIKNNFEDGVKIVVVGSQYVIYIVDNEESTFEIPVNDNLPSGGRKGIVIATGSVRLQGEYTGLIIAKGTITLFPGASINAPNGMLEEIFSANEKDVNRYFREYASGTSENSGSQGNNTGQIQVSDYIYYDNWRKNE